MSNRIKSTHIQYHVHIHMHINPKIKVNSKQTRGASKINNTFTKKQ